MRSIIPASYKPVLMIISSVPSLRLGPFLFPDLAFTSAAADAWAARFVVP